MAKRRKYCRDCGADRRAGEAHHDTCVVANCLGERATFRWVALKRNDPAPDVSIPRAAQSAPAPTAEGTHGDGHGGGTGGER